MEHKSTPGPSEQDSHRLRRVLTLREAVALGVGGTIGGGIFVLVGAAAGVVDTLSHGHCLVHIGGS